MSSSPRRSKRRRRSSFLRTHKSPKLFDYFVVVGVHQTNYNAPTNKEFLPNAKDIGWEPVVQYSYNSNKIVSTSSSSSVSISTSPPSSIPKLQQRYSQLHTTKESENEELELMEQIRKFAFCDLSDLVNRYNSLSDKDRESRKYYKILQFKHGLQSERFTFCVTKSSGTRLYGHCRRVFSPDVNLKPTEMPTALVLISSHGFHTLFDQIMDHIVARWLICHQAIFPILDALLLNAPPALGDTFRVTIKSQVSKDDEILTFKLNSTYHVSLKKLFQTLSVDNILWLISCVLTERRMIFYCHSLETLSECIHGLLALIYPFRWQHIFVPVLPEQLINYLAAPMPFIIGIKSYLAHSKTEFEISEVVLVDLDKQSVRSTDELQQSLKALPSDPSWKLKRELKKNLKKYSLYIQTHDDYRQKYGHYNYKSFDFPKFNQNIDEAAKGWDDLSFYDAFLAFFVLFIGDWRNFYDETNKNVPKPPYHLSNQIETNEAGNDSSASLKQSVTTTSHTPPLENSYDDKHQQQQQQQSPYDDDGGGQTDNINNNGNNGNNGNGNDSKFKIKNIRKFAGQVKKVGGKASEKLKKKLRDEAKRREVTKEKKMYYNAESLEYIELLCQSQLFQTWFVRQQKEATDSVKKISGIQDRYDYVLQNFNQIGASYTGCYKYLCQDSKYRNANHHIHGNLKQVIELTASFTSNRDYTALMQQQQSIQLTLKKLSVEATKPMSYDAIRNIILYRLNDCFGKNNHPHGLMALYLLANLMENSSDRILIESMNNFVFYANVLTKYQHEKMVIAKQMNKLALEIVKLSTRLEELKKKKIEKYVAFGDDYEYKYDSTKQQQEETTNNNNKKGGGAFIDDKIAQIDFANIANNKQDQSLLGNYLQTNLYDSATNLFTEVSQFQANNAQNYRERASRGEVRMIPPFEHLRNEFAMQMPDDLLLNDNNNDQDILAFFSDVDDDDDDDEMDENELKQKQDQINNDNNNNKKRPSERASDFAMNILNSCSPRNSNNPNVPKLKDEQLSIFDLGHKVSSDAKIISSGSFISDGGGNDDDDDNNSQSKSHSDYDGGFLSRTDTRRDNTGQTIRAFKKDSADWVNFEDYGDNNNHHNDDPFRTSFFTKNSEEQSALDAILFNNNNNNINNGQQPKKKISKRIKGGLGNVFNKVKETGKKVTTRTKRTGSKTQYDNGFGIDDVNPVSNTTSSPHPTTTQSKDFDALNFNKNKKHNKPPRHNNIHKADPNNAKAASLFDGFDFNQDAQTQQQQKQQQQKQQQPIAHKKAMDTFGDLFGDFSSNSNHNLQETQSQIQQKKSVKDVMQNAYNNKSHNKVQPKTTNNLFDDLFD